jgi:hypothetical protein
MVLTFLTGQFGGREQLWFVYVSASEGKETNLVKNI